MELNDAMGDVCFFWFDFAFWCVGSSSCFSLLPFLPQSFFGVQKASFFVCVSVGRSVRSVFLNMLGWEYVSLIFFYFLPSSIYLMRLNF